MRESIKKKNNIIIGSLIGVVLLMAVGYAALSTVLNIGATTNISSTWNIYIKSMTVDKEGTADDTHYTFNQLSATVEAELEKPGDSITYNIEVRNDGIRI